MSLGSVCVKRLAFEFIFTDIPLALCIDSLSTWIEALVVVIT